jgi:hypothetical protein
MVDMLFGRSGCGCAVLTIRVSGSGVSIASMPRVKTVKEDGEFSTVGMRQSV